MRGIGGRSKDDAANGSEMDEEREPREQSGENRLSLMELRVTQMNVLRMSAHWLAR